MNHVVFTAAGFLFKLLNQPGLYILQFMEVVFGTSNPAKIDDIRKIIQNADIKLKTLGDLDIILPEIDENGATYEDNAGIKYDALRPLVPENIILVTEDSGIEIDTLGGEPGIHARRWSDDSRELSDQEIIDKTLSQLKHQQNRTARFISVLVFGGGSLKKQSSRGELVGSILEAPDPNGAVPGFPYRALFYVPQLKKMLYQIHDIPAHQRPDVLTHREQAWKKLERVLSEK